MIELRGELSSVVTDIRQSAKDRLSASDRLGLIDLIVDMPLEIVQGNDYE